MQAEWPERLWQCYVRCPENWKREVSADTVNMPNQPVVRKWVSTKEEFIDFCRIHKDRALYVDIYAFDKFDENGNPAEDSQMWGDLCFDIEVERLMPRKDGKVERLPDLKLGWDVVKRIVQVLSEMGVPQRNIWVSTSGHRGFHLRVPIVTFLYQVEPEAYARKGLNIIYKVFMEKIRERLPEDMRDAVCDSPYSHRRPFRLENTQHPLPPRLYCVPLPLNFLSLSISQVLELAREPQPVEWDPEALVAFETPTQMLQEIIREHDQKTALPREPREFPVFEEEWTRRPCIKVCLQSIQEAGELCWLGRTQITSLAILAGWSDIEIMDLFTPCHDFNQRVSLDHIRRIQEKIEHPRKEGELLLIPCDRMRNDVWLEIQKDYGLAGKTPPEIFCDPNNCPLMITDIKLAEISAREFGRRCRTNILISGVGASYRVPIYVEITCQAEESGNTICSGCSYRKEPLRGGLWAKEQLLLVGATEATQKFRGARLLVERKLREKGNHDSYLLCLSQCLKNKKLRDLISVKGSWGTITECYALDTVSELTIDEKAVAPRMIKIYVSRQPPVSGAKVTCIGTVGSLYETGQLTFIATETTPIQEAIETFDLEKEKAILEKMRNQDPREFAGKVADTLGLVQREDAILAILLTYHSALYINYAGKMLPGWVSAELYGPTRTAKSEGAKGIKRLCGQGIYLVLETGTRTGLLYTIHPTKIGYILLWGELVFGDRGLAIIDGSNKMRGEEWIEFRESRSDGILRVRRAVSGDAWMRTRLITIRNPERGESFDEYLYKIQAIKQAYQPPDIARLDILVPVDVVPISAIVSRPSVGEEEKAEISQLFRASVLWAWSRKTDDIEFTPEAFERIKEHAKDLYQRYEDKEIPTVSSDIEHKLAKICVAWSTLKHSVDETHQKVIVTGEDVDEAVAWYNQILKENELDKQVELTRKTTVLPEPERQKILAEIGDIGQEILKILAQEGHVQRDALASYLEIEKKSLDHHTPKLKRWGLIGSSQYGYNLKPKGKKLVKSLLVAPEEQQPLETGHPCEVCGQPKGKLHLIHGRGMRYICDSCLPEYEGAV